MTVLMVVGGIDTADAVPLSKAVVFVGSLATMTLNLRRVLSFSDVLVDYDIVRIMVPASLMGTYVGVVLNWVFPDWLIVMLLSVTLLAMSLMVTRTTLRQYAEEQQLQGRQWSDDASGALGFAASEARAAAPEDERTPASTRASESGEEAASSPAAPPGRPDAEGTRAQGTVAAVKLLPGPSKSRRELTRRDVAVAVSLLVAVVFCGAFRLHAAACQAALPKDVARDCHHPVLHPLGDRMEARILVLLLLLLLPLLLLLLLLLLTIIILMIIIVMIKQIHIMVNTQILLLLLLIIIIIILMMILTTHIILLLLLLLLIIITTIAYG